MNHTEIKITQIDNLWQYSGPLDNGNTLTVTQLNAPTLEEILARLDRVNEENRLK